MKTKILQYSALTIAFLSIHKTVYSEAIYTDIDPDVILDEDFEGLLLDLNNDELNDFRFENDSYWIYISTDGYHLRQRLWATVLSTLNDIQGSYDNFGSQIRYYPYALYAGSPINSEQKFQNWYFQRMAFRTFATLVTSSGTITYPTIDGGNWYPEVLDHYVGVRFIDTDSCYHYGWIRCDVKDEGRTLVVKDYAYETKCGIGIIAGDTIGDTTVAITETILPGISIYSFGNTMYVHIQDMAGRYELGIFNMSGDLIYSDVLSNAHTAVPLNDCSTGYYVADVTVNGASMRKKIFIGN